MKITKSQLRNIIREEHKRLTEMQGMGSEDFVGAFEEQIRTINEALKQAMNIVYAAADAGVIRHSDVDAMKGYWYGHIKTALGGEWASGYTTHATTMADTLEMLLDPIPMEIRGPGEDYDER